MVNKVVVLTCVFLLFVKTEAFVRRDAPGPDFLGSIQKNLDAFRKCLDQSLGSAVDDINVKKINPALNQVGDSLNRVSKAFDDLTAPQKVGAN